MTRQERAQKQGAVTAPEPVGLLQKIRDALTYGGFAAAEDARREHFRRSGHPAAPNVHLGDGPWWCMWHPRQYSIPALQAALDDWRLCRRCRPLVNAELDSRNHNDESTQGER